MRHDTARPMLQNLPAVPVGTHHQRAKDRQAGRRLRLAPAMAREVVCGVYHGRARASASAADEGVAQWRQGLPDVGALDMSTRWHKSKLAHCLYRPSHRPPDEYLMVTIDGWLHYGNGTSLPATGGPYCSREVAKRQASAWRIREGRA